MNLTCRRCNTTFAVSGGTTSPCPGCGSLDVSTKSPRAATTERNPGEYSAPVSGPPPAAASLMPYGHQPLQAQSPAPPSALYPTPVPAAYPPSAPYAQPPAQALPHTQLAYGMQPVQPVSIVIQNHITPAPYYPYAPPPMAMVPYQRRKDAGIATLLSFFLPGGGQLYNGQIGKGVAFILVSIFVNFPLMFVGVGFFTALVTWIWAMVDAHQSAERINRGEIVV